MSGSNAILAEALLRLEYKIDLLMQGLGITAWQQMEFSSGLPCPACRKAVEYQVDIVNQVVKRVCGCASGKQPPLISLFPVQPQGADHGQPADPAGSEDAGPGAEDRRRR